ncbi:MAG TPA: glycerol-3-phosphate 1-O-acyltransferase PlsY [Gemmatimonadales bacterium]|nr:glycerol-3-phosphate 1-O-acyltransferase PlsY [Gemmatimonadales bacterium]
MTEPTRVIVWILVSYLLGAVPTSYLVARLFKGIDLREQGSRNLGATNLYRTLGWKYAVPVGLFDVAKGALPVVLLGPLVPEIALFPVYCGVAAILGHVFSVFVGFKGGKGVATAAGVVLGLAPLALLAVAVVWAIVVKLTGYVSLGSVIAAALFPIAAELLHPGRPEPLWIDIGLAVFLILKHRSNLQRLIQGTENRFGRHGREGATPAQ